MDAKRFLFVSADAALITDLAWQVHREGHDEKTYAENSRNAAVAFETDSREGIHLEDAKNVDGQWRAAGENGMPIVVTGKERRWERPENGATGG